MYGATECSRVAYLEPSQLDHHPQSVGKPIEGVVTRVVDEMRSNVGSDELGELLVSGPNVMMGYWGMATSTSHSLYVDDAGRSWLATGDLFRRDEAGYLYFSERIGREIKTNDLRVHPTEVEHALLSIPGVLHAYVDGVPHPIYGQMLRAFVVRQLNSAITDRDIIQQCRANLEPHKVPKKIIFSPHLSQTLTGKITHQTNSGFEAHPQSDRISNARATRN